MSTPEQMPPIVIAPETAVFSDLPRTDERFGFEEKDFEVDTGTKTKKGEPPMRRPHLSQYLFAELLFGHSSRMWIRHQFDVGKDRLDGKPFEAKVREPKGGTGAHATMKTFTVPDMERLAFAFLINGAVTGEQYQRAMAALTAMAAVVGVHPRRPADVPAASPGDDLPENLPCPFCGTPFSTRKALKIHAARVHAPAEKPKAKTRAPRKGAIPPGDPAKNGVVQVIFREAGTP
jgi:hypothetical protein